MKDYNFEIAATNKILDDLDRLIASDWLAEDYTHSLAEARDAIALYLKRAELLRDKKIMNIAAMRGAK